MGVCVRACVRPDRALWPVAYLKINSSNMNSHVTRGSVYRSEIGARDFPRQGSDL